MIRIKSAFLITLVGLFTTAARADLILSPLQQTGVTGIAGSSQLVTVMGILTDTDPAGADPMDLTMSSIQVSVISPDGNFIESNVDTSPWLMYAPAVSLIPGQSTVSFDMFTIDFAAATMPDVETWNFVVYGDYDVPNVMLSGNTVIGSGSFTVTTEPVGFPEPGSFSLMGIALSFAAAYQRRRFIT